MWAWNLMHSGICDPRVRWDFVGTYSPAHEAIHVKQRAEACRDAGNVSRQTLAVMWRQRSGWPALRYSRGRRVLHI